jgi:hypothetical protein
MYVQLQYCCTYVTRNELLLCALEENIKSNCWLIDGAMGEVALARRGGPQTEQAIVGSNLARFLGIYTLQ